MGYIKLEELNLTLIAPIIAIMQIIVDFAHYASPPSVKPTTN